jgi:hypothetical protein
MHLHMDKARGRGEGRERERASEAKTYSLLTGVCPLVEVHLGKEELRTGPSAHRVCFTRMGGKGEDPGTGLHDNGGCRDSSDFCDYGDDHDDHGELEG